MVDPSAREIERLNEMHRFERDLWSSGTGIIGGVDEVGRGPLAGPVVAACVVIDRPLLLPFLNDSKKVTVLRRRRLDAQIREQAVACAIGEASVAEIDTLSISGATRLAMERAICRLTISPAALLVDAVHIPTFQGPQRAIIGGDALSAVIAAASILAKVYRDALLEQLHLDFPVYGFSQHKGYGTAAHLAALREHGPCEHHRRSFAPVRQVLFSMPV